MKTPVKKITTIFRITIASFVAIPGVLPAQPINVEGMVGNNYLFYQHGITKYLNDRSNWSVRHIANVMVHYNHKIESGGMPHEIMNQGYVGYHLPKYLSLHVGGFYANATDIRPSAAVQFAIMGKKLLFVVISRADVMTHGAGDVFTLTEFRPSLKGKLKLYTRLQTMSNFGPSFHNRGYQQFRVGLDIRDTQFGLGLNLDNMEKMPSFTQT